MTVPDVEPARAGDVASHAQAEGHEKWQPFDPGQFKPYNITGKGTISDNGVKDETLSLRYVPAKA